MKAGWRQGHSLDLSVEDPLTGKKWDLADPVQQRRVLKMLQSECPYLVEAHLARCSRACKAATGISARLSGDRASRRPEYC